MVHFAQEILLSEMPILTPEIDFSTPKVCLTSETAEHFRETETI